MYKIRKPRKEGDYYVWQESYADAIDYNYVINTLVFQRMKNYIKYDGSTLFKYYRSNQEALNDYFKAVESLLKDVLRGKRDKHCGLVYSGLFADYIYTLENS